MNLDYTPPPSLVPYLTSDKFITIQIGPYGCVDKDTEFLTPTGWKAISEYTTGDKVAQWVPETGKAEFVTPDAYIKLPCEKFYHFKHIYGLDMMVSPEHRIVYRLRRKGPKIHEKTAEEVVAWYKRNGADMVRIPVTFKAPDAEGLPYTDDELRLAVAICADGYIQRPGQDAVTLNLKKQYKKYRVELLLDRLGIPFTMHKAGPGYSRYYFHFKLHDKVFGPSWWKATPHQLQVIAEELPNWDGGMSKKGNLLFRTKQKASADFAQYAFTSTGVKATLALDNKDTYRIICSAVGADTVGLSGGKGPNGKVADNLSEVPSPDGFKYCFSVPSTYLILRRNGCIFVTGNSGKTTASIMKIAVQASKMAACPDGVRRSRCCIVRNTSRELSDTTQKDFLEKYVDGVAGDFIRSKNEFILKFDNPDGTKTECDCLFRGLDSDDDVKKLLSLQLSFAFIDEIRQISPEVFKALQGRVGRYPNKTLVPPRPEWGKNEKGAPIGGCVTDDGKPNFMVFASSNPPDRGTWWGDFLENPPTNAAVFFQPSGRSPECDWDQYLPDNYYQNLVESHDEEWCKVYVDGQLGASLEGQPVFKNFNKDVHVAKEHLRPVRGAPIVIGCDAALHPAAIYTQIDYKGRLLVLHEDYATGMGALTFVRDRVKRTLAEKFGGIDALICVDPAANTRSQSDERTWLDVARSLGMRTVTAPTNVIAARLTAVDAFLTRMIDGEPGLVVDPGCTTLIDALQTKYQYKAKKDGDTEEKPSKTHPFSDVADALQYACLYSDTSGVFKHRLSAPRPVQRVKWVYV